MELLATELRLGNYVWEDYGGYMIVTAIYPKTEDENQVVYLAKNDKMPSGYFHISKIEAIPLTEELLLNCGFKRSQTQDKYFVKDNKFGISTADGKFRFIMGNFVCQLVLREIESLHLLQNLYFILTDEELPINL